MVMRMKGLKGRVISAIVECTVCFSSVFPVDAGV